MTDRRNFVNKRQRGTPSMGHHSAPLPPPPSHPNGWIFPPTHNPASIARETMGEDFSVYNVSLKGMNPNKTLSAERARELMVSSQENFDESLAIIRHICDHEIEEAAQKHRSSIMFSVPQSLFGREEYSISNMGKRLAMQLHDDGYDIEGSSKSFRITWGQSQIQVPQIPREYSSVKHQHPQSQQQPLVQFTGGSIFKPPRT